METSKTVTINDIDLADPVWALKEAIQNKEGIPPDQQRLIFTGKQLEDSRSLHDYNVKAGSTMHMVLRMRGGQREPHLAKSLSTHLMSLSELVSNRSKRTQHLKHQLLNYIDLIALGVKEHIRVVTR